MRRSVILDTTVRFVFDAAIVLSVYLLFAGHNRPGGGFVGGLVASAALALRFVAGGIDEVDAVVRIRPWTLVYVGLGIAATVAAIPLVAGGPLLDHGAWEVHLGPFGDVKFTSATAFDAGVYLLVVGLFAMILEGLGKDPEPGDETPEDER